MELTDNHIWLKVWYQSIFLSVDVHPKQLKNPLCAFLAHFYVSSFYPGSNKQPNIAWVLEIIYKIIHFFAYFCNLLFFLPNIALVLHRTNEPLIDMGGYDPKCKWKTPRKFLKLYCQLGHFSLKWTNNGSVIFCILYKYKLFLIPYNMLHYLFMYLLIMKSTYLIWSVFLCSYELQLKSGHQPTNFEKWKTADSVYQVCNMIEQIFHTKHTTS